MLLLLLLLLSLMMIRTTTVFLLHERLHRINACGAAGTSRWYSNATQFHRAVKFPVVECQRRIYVGLELGELLHHRWLRHGNRETCLKV